MKQSWNPRRFTPLHLRICLLHWNGLDFSEISQLPECPYSEQHVARIVLSDAGQAILAELSSRTLDTVLDVQASAQAYAPECLEEKARLAIGARDERVRNLACTDILAIAGHQPVKRISVERPDSVSEKYKGLSDDELRATLLSELGLTMEDSGNGDTVH